jgi:hypothetical protein
MVIQPIIEKRTKLKITLTPEEKAQRKAQIDLMSAQVAERMSEYQDRSAIDLKAVRREVTKAYDKKIRERIAAHMENK